MLLAYASKVLSGKFTIQSAYFISQDGIRALYYN